MTFSTYENSPTSSEETIVGLFSEHYVPPLSSRDVFINVDVVSSPLRTRVAESAGRYIDFAVQTLNQRHLLTSMDDRLYRFITSAEQQSVNNPTQLLALFQQYLGQRPPARPPVPDKPKDIPAHTSGGYVPEESLVRSGPRRISPIPSQTRPLLGPPDDSDSREVADQAHRLPTRYRGLQLSLPLNAALFLLLLALLIFLPFNQNAVRQEAINNVHSQLTQTANATQLAQSLGVKGNSVQFLYTSPQTSVTNGQTITLYIAVQDTGQNTWSNGTGYHLACVDPQDLDCKQAKFSTLMDQSVPPGGTYVFIITIKAHFAVPNVPDQTPHMFDVRLAQGKQQFGDKKTLSYFVKQ